MRINKFNCTIKQKQDVSIQKHPVFILYNPGIYLLPRNL